MKKILMLVVLIFIVVGCNPISKIAEMEIKVDTENEISLGGGVYSAPVLSKGPVGCKPGICHSHVRYHYEWKCGCDVNGIYDCRRVKCFDGYYTVCH